MEMITAEEVSKILGVPRQTLYGWLNKKTCPFGSYRIQNMWRFNKEEVIEYLQKAKI